MEYENIMCELEQANPEIQTYHLMLKLYEIDKKKRIVEWVREHPEYWKALCSPIVRDMPNDYIAAIMDSLKCQGILEFQLLWLWKCRDRMDLYGNVLKEK